MDFLQITEHFFYKLPIFFQKYLRISIIFTTFAADFKNQLKWKVNLYIGNELQMNY